MPEEEESLITDNSVYMLQYTIKDGEPAQAVMEASCYTEAEAKLIIHHNSESILHRIKDLKWKTINYSKLGKSAEEDSDRVNWYLVQTNNDISDKEIIYLIQASRISRACAMVQESIESPTRSITGADTLELDIII